MTALSPTVAEPGASAAEIIELAAGTPDGPERVALLEAAADLAVGAGDEDAEVAARLELVSAYGGAGDVWRGIDPFLWCIGRRAERPDLFTEEQTALIGRLYRWMTVVAAINPQIGVAQVRVLQQGFEAYAREIDMPEHDLAEQWRIIALYLGREDEAAERFERWLDTPAGGDRACATHVTIDEAMEEHRWEDAVRYAVPVLDGTWTCEDQPANVEAMTLVPMLLSGRPERAWANHLHAYLTHRRDGAERGWLREHLALLALTGRVDRGLRILRRHAGATAECGVAADLLELLTGAVMLLRAAVRAGRGDEPFGATMPRATLGLSGHHVQPTDTVADALEITTLWLDALCDAFDERNGNRSVGDATRRYRDLAPVVEPVPRPVLHLVREPEPLPAALSSSRLEDAPAPAPADGWTGLLGAPVVDVELARREERLNAVLDAGDPARSLAAVRELAEDLRLAGRNLDVLTVVELGLEVAEDVDDAALALHLHRVAMSALEALGEYRGQREAALNCAAIAERSGDDADVRLLTELVVGAALRVGDSDVAAELLDPCAEVRLDDEVEDLLGRERYLRRAARASLVWLPRAVRAARLRAAGERLDDSGAREADTGSGTGPALDVDLDVELAGLVRDRAWVAERADD